MSFGDGVRAIPLPDNVGTYFGKVYFSDDKSNYQLTTIDRIVAYQK
ncbi:hypothetical protein NARC_10029 [Candidatus Nitrosocosmicus arcticus]|uniref:Uncharacterized protein n=1 Tax=Candidatus Nitrosocosmicus arcticus TaxID=2035267 RepID=A0A557SYF5_9ARCH|nr:hypothetical protein NARC_10029 [Candidatus Nitrosocosmicus arcticus]